MGYELHITRADEYYQIEDHPIGLAEWIAYARAHAALTEGGWLDGPDNDLIPVYAYTCADGAVVSLAWSEGAINIKGFTSQDCPRELLSVAADLQANLIGDEGERYTTDGVIPPE
jgi:hypothetical protein